MPNIKDRDFAHAADRNDKLLKPPPRRQRSLSFSTSDVPPQRQGAVQYLPNQMVWNLVPVPMVFAPPQERPSPQLHAEDHSRSQSRSREIRFHDRNHSYYEFTNFAEYPVRYDGRDYRTGEHLYQALKFDDAKLSELIRSQKTAREANDLAQKMSNLRRRGWIEQGLRVETMEKVLLLKFTQHEDLKRKLLKTDDATLIEDSSSDDYWGIGSKSKGQNQFGVSLMKVRSTLKHFER